MKYLILSFIFTAATAVAASSKLEMDFKPSADEFKEATKAYNVIWKENRTKILSAMERYSKKQFQEKKIKVIIFEGVSFSGNSEAPMRLRASYSADTKKATLIHELGHRLLHDVPNAEGDLHKTLFLVLYDIWVDLYGQKFADEQVAIEKLRGGVYPAAWDWALGMSKEQRSSEFEKLLSETQKM